MKIDIYKFKHFIIIIIIAIVSRSWLSIFFMAREHDNNSEPAFHNKRQVTWENLRIDYLNFGLHSHPESKNEGPVKPLTVLLSIVQNTIV